MRNASGPQLLVSVRNVAEAHAALAGGCDVLDLKEPARGAMGMPDLATIAAVAQQLCLAESSRPLSVALGEAREWQPRRPTPCLPSGTGFLKLGTAALDSLLDWPTHFERVKRQFEAAGSGVGSGTKAANEGASCNPSFIVVAYADYQVARGPAPEEVVEQATPCGCAGVLIDTFSKGDKRLLDWLGLDRLGSLAVLARSRGLAFAVAGRLQIGDLPAICTVAPDIVGIRSAACRGGIRTAEIDPVAVRAFSDALRLEARSMVSSPRA